MYYCYQAYGLKISSAIELPELIEIEETDPDVIIKRGQVERTSAEQAADEGYFRRSSQEAYFYWKQQGAFLVKDGREIIVDRAPNAEERLNRMPILGAALALILHQRGFLILHGSALSVNNTGVVFVGVKGQGKSTMAATLYARGHDLITDDVVAIDLNADPVPTIFPAFPQMKLWPPSVEAALGKDPDSLPLLASGYEKRNFRVTERFVNNTLPLGQIYSLVSGSELKLECLPPQRAVVEAIAHSYFSPVAAKMLVGKDKETHLLQCTKLLNKVPLYRLERPRDLDLLPKIANMVEENAKV